MASLSRIRVHPIKALDPVERESVGISPVGGLEGDRAYAIVDGDGTYVNGKRTAAVHPLRASYDLEAGVVELRVDGDGRPPGDAQPVENRTGDLPTEPVDLGRFDLDGDRGALADRLSDYFGTTVTVEAAPGGELADSRVYSGAVAGATVVSEATIETVASWFPDLGVDDVRRRFRANLEFEGVEAFWEDRLVRSGGSAAGSGADSGPARDGPRFRVGDVTFSGVKPITRCVVPTRDPFTGSATDGFRERFVRKREETFPDWADRDAFDHSYALTTLAHPDEDDWGRTISRGDPVERLD